MSADVLFYIAISVFLLMVTGLYFSVQEFLKASREPSLAKERVGSGTYETWGFVNVAAYLVRDLWSVEICNLNSNGQGNGSAKIINFENLGG